MVAACLIHGNSFYAKCFSRARIITAANTGLSKHQSPAGPGLGVSAMSKHSSFTKLRDHTTLRCGPHKRRTCTGRIGYPVRCLGRRQFPVCVAAPRLFRVCRVALRQRCQNQVGRLDDALITRTQIRFKRFAGQVLQTSDIANGNFITLLC